MSDYQFYYRAAETRWGKYLTGMEREETLSSQRSNCAAHRPSPLTSERRQAGGLSSLPNNGGRLSVET
jgi:hypothetical protein